MPAARCCTSSRQVADGLGELTTGLQTAADGAGRLADGTQQLQQGAATLTDGLTSAVQRVPTLGASDPEGTADQLADPTQVRVESRNEAQYYAQGLAPFFFGIALCVFGVAVFTVLRPVNPRGLASAAGSPRVALAGFLPVALIGVTGGLVLLAIVQLGLGLDPHSWRAPSASSSSGPSRSPPSPTRCAPRSASSGPRSPSSCSWCSSPAPPASTRRRPSRCPSASSTRCCPCPTWSTGCGSRSPAGRPSGTCATCCLSARSGSGRSPRGSGRRRGVGGGGSRR